MSDMLRIICGDALDKLRELPNESVQCCVTSPPYWGLRDYGTAEWEGGDSECDHKRYAVASNLWKSDASTRGGAHKAVGSPSNPYLRDCGKCGAKRIDAQLGLEKTPEEYVERMVEIFREVRRVLRKDGTLWLNLGDSYAGSGKGAWDRDDVQKEVYVPGVHGAKIQNETPGLKPKDLVGIPWRVAFALQADGWWLRQDIIWAKPNPMPESVTDRCTKSHEYIFLLTKSARYFYDADAVQEPISESYEADTRPHGVLRQRFYPESKYVKSGMLELDRSEFPNGHRETTRNKRSVWTVTTQPYPDAHFATYPPDLIKPCILAGSRVGDTVLDPFAGSGTTGMVSLELGRKAILIELNPKYVELIEQRCNVTFGLLLA